MGDQAGKMRSRLGRKGAVIAGAHLLGRIYHTMIKNQTPYAPEIMEQNQQKWKESRVKYLEAQLEKLKK